MSERKGLVLNSFLYSLQTMGYLQKISRVFRSLSAQLLFLTILFVMLAEVLIFVPSVAFFRLNYLDKKIEFAHLASLALLASPDNMVSKELKAELLFRVGARSVVFRSANSAMLMLSEDMPAVVDASFDLSERSSLKLIEDAAAALLVQKNRIIRVTSPIENAPTSSLEIVLDEAPLVAAMLDYAKNIFWLSLAISVVTAVLVFLSLHWLLVRPMGRLSASMIAFRRKPEDPKVNISPSGRMDEIGIAERELEIMQTRLRFALKQKQHLAALGTAVTKISHDLRNILSTSHIVSDGLAQLDDPRVQKVVPRLVASIDRAIDLCTETLKYGKAGERLPQKSRFLLAPLIKEVCDSVALPASKSLQWDIRVSEKFTLCADREQIYRALLNLCRNASEALKDNGKICVAAQSEQGISIIKVMDNGPGIPSMAMEHLFEPFVGSVKNGGTGLGLSIARELVEAHGGDLFVEKTDDKGTIFVIRLPD
ncbi:sensor histidine kinase [Sneathiella aquimaris]|uniref:sensor histidine kinase n=1 Tax=Sneathiella aquimaris TaxID=2599305 RepID=UPI00146D4017|nr:HAMP domain-containing sensor histidine kinase [Sneathiella aquimaris]